jgi:diguanylate cyclase (GGDEF)-like protein
VPLGNWLNLRRFKKFTLFIYRHITLILITLLCVGIGIALSGTLYLSTNLVESQALQNAKVSVEILKDAWLLYSQNVAKNLRDVDSVSLTPKYHQLDNAIPAPATYTIELGELVSKSQSGLLFRIYSDYPFPNRRETGGVKDQFEKEALQYLRINPTAAFYRKEQSDEHLLFRYAEAIQIQPSCVHCHNTSSDSPKKDWKVGDVRGVIEVNQPIDDFVLQAKDGLAVIWVSVIVIVAFALISVAIVISYLRNINQILQQKVQEKTLALSTLANLDSLTQLANRRRFDEVLEQEWRRMRRLHLPLALILCDVDYFKRYNDTYGHQAGDECLRSIAQILRSHIKRPGDLVARYGGEEFAIILPNTECSQATQLATQILNAVLHLKIAHEQSDISPYITLSIGISSIVPNGYHQPANLVQLADQALYEAKSQGRNRLIMKPIS